MAEHINRLRTIRQVLKHIQTADPSTAITETAIRRAVSSGSIPSRKSGTKYLITLEDVYAHYRITQI